MDETDIIYQLSRQLDAERQRSAGLEAEIGRQRNELHEIRQRLELRNISLERLQSQFTLAAEAVNKLLAERAAFRVSRWAKFGSFVGFLPKLEDDLR